MKVLYISGGDYKYGAPKSMMTMIEGLREKYGIDVILLTKKHNDLNDYCDKVGIENYSYWSRDIMAGSPYSNFILTLLKHVVKYVAYIAGSFTMHNIKKLPIDFSAIDIIHSNTNRQDIGAYISQKYGIKHIWHIREMGKEDYNVVFYKRKCIQYMNRNTDLFVAISNVVRDKWVGLGIQNQKIITIYDGMSVGQIRRRTGGENNKIRIVMTGHVQPNKGQLQLVKAISILPLGYREIIELDIVGEAYSDYKEKIESAIKDGGIRKQVRLLGYRSNVGEMLADYDIGVTCSKAEGFGRCTVEYMLAGLVTIASDTGANPEIIVDKVSGLLYKYNDIKHLSKTIQWVIEHGKERQRIAEAGYLAASTEYSKEEHADKIYEVYQKCLMNP